MQRRKTLVEKIGVAIGGILFCTFFISVQAQTPDGQPPSNEGVCDELQGGTPGLYGLCVAYCEAQDCDATVSSENVSAQCKMANPRVLQNYRKKMKAGDPDMPCIRASCPCWTPEDLASIDGKLRDGTTNHVNQTCTDVVGNTIIDDFTLTAQTSGEFHNALAQVGGNNRLVCRYLNQEIIDGVSIPPFDLNAMEITDEEFVTCRNQILDRCDELGRPY